MRPSDSGSAGASASLTLLDDLLRHRLRRAALHLPPQSQERGPLYFYHGLLASYFFSSTLAGGDGLRVRLSQFIAALNSSM